MEKDVVISVKDLKKSFKVYYDKGNSLKEKLLFLSRNRYEKREVLKGISFQLKKGEAVGLIGRNGCGKSTTLKLLTRIMYPTSGKVQIHGRVSSLIELGAGFHPDMSGRENIYTNASIFGLTKKEIDARIDDIIAFSELGEYIDNPVRTYSSGMYMRLAFSVAINVEADVLLIDEILAVGDVSFQEKCFDKLKQIKRAGTTIVIVSHSLGQIEEICDRSIWIEEGKIKMEDTPERVHQVYLAQMEEERMELEKEEYKNKQEEKKQEEEVEEFKEDMFQGRKVLRLGKHEMRYTDAVLLDENDEPCNVYHTGDTFAVKLQYINESSLGKAIFCIRIYDEQNQLCYGTNTNTDVGQLIELGKKGEVQITFSQIPLLKGTYIIDVDIVDETGQTQDAIHEACSIKVLHELDHTGMAYIGTKWRIKKGERE